MPMICAPINPYQCRKTRVSTELIAELIFTVSGWAIFRKIRRNVPGCLPSLLREEAVRQGSLFHYKLSSHGRKRKTIPFKAD